ncbi:hypothetical protein SXCC_01766 [Gluconacetobacter sp. SXCC-1]|nr:hypothetical protein SXCC_01766 [Gluconacetobacter sp. SXCC-1]
MWRTIDGRIHQPLQPQCRNLAARSRGGLHKTIPYPGPMPAACLYRAGISRCPVFHTR